VGTKRFQTLLGDVYFGKKSRSPGVTHFVVGAFNSLEAFALASEETRPMTNKKKVFMCLPPMMCSYSHIIAQNRNLSNNIDNVEFRY